MLFCIITNYIKYVEPFSFLIRKERVLLGSLEYLEWYSLVTTSKLITIVVVS